MPLSTGEKLGPYEILAPVGAGGMGEVYRAHDPRLDRQVAIKVLGSHLASVPSARERLQREARAAAALDHPFICKVFEIGEESGQFYIVMEFVPGQTLEARIAAGPLSTADALRFAGEVTEALEEAHSKKFVHRDLKPSNIMLTQQGRAKVMDFGLAKRFGGAPAPENDATVPTEPVELTVHGTVVGTPNYMSPEQVRGEALDQRSDVFSFGILLCEMLGSPHPFRKANSADTMVAILREPPNLTGGLPPGLMVLIRRLLAKTPADRYQTMGDLRADLTRLAATLLPGYDSQAITAVQLVGRLPVIGRDTERAELLRALDQALTGKGSLHLTTAILDEGRRRGCFSMTGHCYEDEGAASYVPFIEMLEYSARVAPQDTFRQTLGEAASEIARLMPELRTRYPDIPPAIQLPPEQQRRYLFNSYRGFVERSARLTPIVAVFEDLHWADEPTLQLLLFFPAGPKQPRPLARPPNSTVPGAAATIPEIPVRVCRVFSGVEPESKDVLEIRSAVSSTLFPMYSNLQPGCRREMHFIHQGRELGVATHKVENGIGNIDADVKRMVVHSFRHRS